MKKIIILLMLISSISHAGYGESAGEENREILAAVVIAGVVSWGVFSLMNRESDKSDLINLTDEQLLKRIELGQSIDVYRFNENFSISTGDKLNIQTSNFFQNKNETFLSLKFSF